MTSFRYSFPWVYVCLTSGQQGADNRHINYRPMVTTEEVIFPSLYCTPHNRPKVIGRMTFSARLLSPSRRPYSRHFIILSHGYRHIIAFPIWELGLYLIPSVSIQALMASMIAPDSFQHFVFRSLYIFRSISIHPFSCFRFLGASKFMRNSISMGRTTKDMSLIKQVLQLIKAGESNRDVNCKLPINKKTVKVI